eukprot:Nitzschia sp. Nitz4//scaffold80_size88189//7356//9314//NITZ4_005079-RA/size88189-processed-gene-0.23-mRNA-1//-1//CDS//3329558606//7597//frame0
MSVGRLQSLRALLILLVFISVYQLFVSSRQCGNSGEGSFLSYCLSLPAVSQVEESGILPLNVSLTYTPRRILLGISSTLYFPVDERQRRHLIRNTYLDFDRIHSPNQPNRICSLQQFLLAIKESTSRSEALACHIIYTFILGPANDTIIPQVPHGSVLDHTYFPENLHEIDVTYLNVKESDGVAKRWAWFSYVSTFDAEKNFDYVVYTDAHVLVKPTIFLAENPLLLPSPESGSNILPLPPTKIYAGLPTERHKCVENKCPNLQGSYVMRRFVLLSRDLIDHVSMHLNQSRDKARVLRQRSAESSNESKRTDVPDVYIANAIFAYPAGPIANVSLQGLVAKTSRTNSVGDYLAAFDKYKDALTNYSDPKEESLVRASKGFEGERYGDGPRLLLGILSMDTPLERERREIIRETYIKAFHGSSTPNRICSVHQLIQKTVAERDCQAAYVFVLGGNPQGPKELVDINEDTGPLTVGSPNPSLASETDLVFLNIQENGKEGKSQTFFKYATTVIDDYSYFDYIGKTDTDTVLYPKSLLDKSLQEFPTFPNNMRVYGGDYRIKPSKETLNLGPAYMGGHFYLMSPDLARYITSPQCNRSALAVFSEDQSIGNFIHSWEQPIRRVSIPTFHYDHPVKKVSRMKSLWRKRQKPSKTKK